MEPKGPLGRHRDQSGELSRMHGNTLVSTLRKIYGTNFAAGFTPGTKLSNVLATLDEPSLSRLVADYEGGHLHQRISDAGGSGVSSG